MRFILPLLFAGVLSAHAGLKTDIEFASPGGTRLTLDACTPEGDGPFATCILVHGGGFINGTKTSYIAPLFEPLSKAGFAWFTINYRLAPDHRWPACVDDLETAIRWVKAHAAEYKVDVNRIAIIGESAGGHIVSYVGARAKGETAVAAVVPFYAPHDLNLQVDSRHEPGKSMIALFGIDDLGEAARKRLTEASATTWLHKGMPPYLLIHGNKDTTVPFEQSVRFQARMKGLGNTCDLIAVEGGGHGMGGWKKLGSDYQEEMIRWLKEKLAPAPH